MAENGLPQQTGFNGRLPWWVQAIMMLGVIPSIAIFLILVVTGFVESPFTRDLAARAKEHVVIVSEIKQTRYSQLAILRVICMQGSKSDDGRRDCLSVGIARSDREGP